MNSKGPFGWENKKNGKVVEQKEKKKIASHFCLVERVEKWRDEKNFVQLKRKMRSLKIEFV